MRRIFAQRQGVIGRSIASYVSRITTLVLSKKTSRFAGV